MRHKHTFTLMTTIQALRQIAVCLSVIARNTARAVNGFVTHRPWIAMALTALIAFAVAAASIMQARADRDAALKAQYRLQQQVDQLSCAVQAERNAR